MKVDFSSNMGLYRKRGPSGAPKTGDQAAFKAELADVAEFSRGGAATLDKSLVTAKASIQSAAAAPADPARVDALKQSVREGAYYVSTDDLIKAILDS